MGLFRNMDIFKLHIKTDRYIAVYRVERTIRIFFDYLRLNGFTAFFLHLQPTLLLSPFLIKFIKASPHAGFFRSSSFYHSLQYLILAGNLKCALNSPLCTYEGHHGHSIGQFIKHLSVAL